MADLRPYGTHLRFVGSRAYIYSRTRTFERKPEPKRFSINKKHISLYPYCICGYILKLSIDIRDFGLVCTYS